VRKTLLFAVLILAAACGNKSKPEPVKSEPPPEKVEKQPAPSGDAALIAEAKQFVADLDRTMRKLTVDASEAQWANETDLTPAHEAATAKASEVLSVEATKLVKTARKFEPVLDKLDPDTRRQLLLLKFQAQPSPDDPAQAKQLAGTFRDAVPQDFAFVGAPILLQLVMLVYGRSGLADRLPMPMNVTISNVPGPPMPLYCAGAKVTALHPVSIAAHGAALNITVQSYMDALNFGLTADRRAVPDVGRLGDYLVEAADELKKAVVAG